MILDERLSYFFSMIIPELEAGIKSQTTTLVKSLELKSGTCQHTNVVKVVSVQGEGREEDPQISTKTKQDENNVVRHYTEIKFKNRSYFVEDIYVFTLTEPKDANNLWQVRSFISSNDSRNSSGSDSNKQRNTRKRPKKVCLFQKTGKHGHRYRKRNTKNIPKNFCKAFSNFMEDHSKKDSPEWAQAKRVLKKIEARDKYNNITMNKMLQNPRIVPFFREFLLNYAEGWITNSKIADKRVHLEAIRIYLELLGKLAYAEVDPSPSDE